MVSVCSVHLARHVAFFLLITISLSISTVDGMEIKNPTGTVNSTTLLCGVAGLLLLTIGGLPLLDRVWALLGTMFWALPGARDVLSVVAGAVLVAVAVTAHRRGRQNAQNAHDTQAAQAADVR